MNILHRITDAVGGLFGKESHRGADENPETLIADAQRRIEKSRREAGAQLVEIQTWAEMARMEMQEAQIRLADVQSKIRLATLKRDKALLTELFLQEETLSRTLSEKQSRYESARAQALRVRDHFRQFEREMTGRMEELSAMRSRSQLIRVQENIRRIDERYEMPGAGIDRVRRGLNERCARIRAAADLREDNTESRVRRLDYQMALERASEKAERLLEGDVAEP